MVVAGAGGFAKQLIEAIPQHEHERLLFFDHDIKKKEIFGKFKVIHSIKDVKKHFTEVDNRFCLGTGIPNIRLKMHELLIKIGGKLSSVVSEKVHISQFVNEIGEGVSILQGVVIEGDVTINDGALINLGASVAHGSTIGSFTELSPACHISGDCTIGSNCRLGTGAIVIPNITIGDNVTIGAGAVVTKNYGNNLVLVGVPALPV